MSFDPSQRERIASLAAAAHLPTISNAREFVEAGPLMNYGVSLSANFYRATYFVDKILKGDRPADLPVEFPKTLYKARARIEQAVGKLKRFKRIALRCEKTSQNYGSFVALALGLILIKSVHTA